MSVALKVKKGDTQPWTFTLSDMSGGVIDLTGTRVEFRLRAHEWDTDNKFARDTKGTNSDYISINSPASDGSVTITPRTADWNEVSDCGIYVGEFRVSDSSDYHLCKDIEIDVQEALW